MAFFQSTGAADQVAEWTSLNITQRQAIKAEFSAANISLVVSAFGSSDAPTKQDPTDTANLLSSLLQRENSGSCLAIDTNKAPLRDRS